MWAGWGALSLPGCGTAGAAGCWQCHGSSVPAQPSLCQLQQHFPSRPMELHLWARRQPLLSCHPNALHGALFGSAEAFVVLPNATRVPAFLLNIVSSGLPQRWGWGVVPMAELGGLCVLGLCWVAQGDVGAMHGDAGTAPISLTPPLVAGRQCDSEANHCWEQAGRHSGAAEVSPQPCAVSRLPELSSGSCPHPPPPAISIPGSVSSIQTPSYP